MLALAPQHETLAGQAHDVMWIGTAAGISRFDYAVPSFMTLAGTSDGLPNDNIHAIALLPSGDKVFGTATGVTLYHGP